MEEDTEPIEWGDMDPSFRSLLETTPAVLDAYKTLKNPKKTAKLDVETRPFQPSSNVEVPPPSTTVTVPDTVKSDDIRAVIQHYHDTSVRTAQQTHSRGNHPTFGKKYSSAVFGATDPHLFGSRATEEISHYLLYNVVQHLP